MLLDLLSFVILAQAEMQAEGSSVVSTAWEQNNIFPFSGADAPGISSPSLG